MNEELKIIIKAVTSDAQKGIQKVKKELGGMAKEGGKSTASLGAALKGVGVAAGIAITAITAVTGALVSLGNKTKQFREEQARLNAAFMSAGSTSEQAAKSYNNLYRFLGDSSKASEAAAHLAKLTTNEKDLAEWTTTLQGVYATFGESLPIEGLTEAANESARVGVVTGTLADALNWAGVNEDAFNASLAACNTTAEREALIRKTLNGIYDDAALLYEKNNADIIAQNEAQARLDATTAKLGKTVTPLLTSLINLSNTLLTALGPAIEWVSNALTIMINAISKAVQWVMSLIGVLGGSKKVADAGEAFQGIAGGVTNASGGAEDLTGNLNDATTAAEKLKRQTAGFDELNIMSSDKSASGASGGPTSGGTGGGGIPSGGTIIDTGGLTGALEETEGKVSGFVQKVKGVLDTLKNVFAPTITAWSGAFETVKNSWNSVKDNFVNGFWSVVGGLATLGEYLIGTFVPDVVNSFSTNLAPMIGDIFGFQLEQAGLNFEFLGQKMEQSINDIIVPALDSVKMVATDTFEAFGKAWDKHGGPLLDKIGVFWEGIREDIDEFYNDVILPIWTKLKEVFDKVWQESLKPLVDNIADAALEIANCVMELWNKFLKPIIDWIQKQIYPILVRIINNIIDTVGAMVKNIGKALSGVITSIKGIVQFITGVFTGDWKKAWEGVKNIFKGIFQSLVNVVKVPLNLIIGAINGLIGGIVQGVNTAIKAINRLSFTVPDWVPGIGGQSFGFNIKELTAPKIPQLATGGIVTQATHLIAGERGREAILPLETHTEWMDKLAEKIAEKNNNPTKVVLMLDDTELGWANIRSINGITKQTGKIQLAMA